MNDTTTIEKLAQARDKALDVADAAGVVFNHVNTAYVVARDNGADAKTYAKILAANKSAYMADDAAYTAYMVAEEAWEKATAKGEE